MPHHNALAVYSSRIALHHRVPHSLPHRSEFDADGNGTIEINEFQDFLFALGEAMSLAEVDAIFTKIDADGSGALDFDEFFKCVGCGERPTCSAAPHVLGGAPRARRRPTCSAAHRVLGGAPRARRRTACSTTHRRWFNSEERQSSTSKVSAVVKIKLRNRFLARKAKQVQDALKDAASVLAASATARPHGINRVHAKLTVGRFDTSTAPFGALVTLTHNDGAALAELYSSAQFSGKNLNTDDDDDDDEAGEAADAEGGGGAGAGAGAAAAAAAGADSAGDGDGKSKKRERPKCAVYATFTVGDEANDMDVSEWCDM